MSRRDQRATGQVVDANYPCGTKKLERRWPSAGGHRIGHRTSHRTSRAAHRRALELQVVRSEIQRGELHFRLAFRGQTFALAMGLATLAACLTAALTGHDGAAIALAASSLVGVVAAFLSARLRDAGAKQDDAR